MKKALIGGLLVLAAAVAAEITSFVTFPEGSDKQLQYNDNGAFGGVKGSTVSGNRVDLTSMTIGSPAARSTFSAAGLVMGLNMPVTLSGSSGTFVSGSSITAGSFFGDGSKLTGIVSTAAINSLLASVGASTAALHDVDTAIGASTAALHAQDLSIGAATATIRADFSAADVAVGASTAALAVSTTALGTQLTAVAAATTSLRDIDTAIGASTAAITLRFNDVGASTKANSTQLTQVAADTTTIKSAADTHAALTNAHSATNAATASRIVLRDSAGGFAAAAVTITSLTATASGASQTSIQTSSGIAMGGGKLDIGTGGFIEWADGSISTTASSGSGAGAATLTAISSVTWCTTNTIAVTANVFSATVPGSTIPYTSSSGWVKVGYTGTMSSGNNTSQMRLAPLINGAAPLPWGPLKGPFSNDDSRDNSNATFAIPVKVTAGVPFNVALAASSDGSINVGVPQDDNSSCGVFYVKDI